jgi:hypothetical protein
MSTKVIGSLTAVALLAALTLCVSALSSNKPNLWHTTAPADQDNPGRSQVEMLPITLRAGGFVPGEMTKPSGEYIISISNLSDVPDLVIRMGRENGEKMHEGKASRRKPYWRQQVRLTPGTYLIGEASHPEWVCRINVTAR